jgi:hypothetical protein
VVALANLGANELLIIPVRCNDKGRCRKENDSYSRLFKLISGLLEDALTKFGMPKFLRREFRVGPVFRMKRARQFSGTTSGPETMGSGFFSELFTHVGQWGHARRSAGTFY